MTEPKPLRLERAEEERPAAEMRKRPPAERGKTFIDDEVVSVITRLAAEEVEGIHRIGEPSLRNFLATLGRGTGVDAEVGMQEAAADIEVVMEMGYPIREVAAEIRKRVIETVERMTGRSMVEVNVHVVDIHVPKVERRSRRELR
jgi:uncharacterized alkaline shock family protein YloU